MSTAVTSIRAADESHISSTAPDHQTTIVNRSTMYQLMHEELARAHAASRLEETISRERAYRLVAARRAARRAEQSAVRARRLLALAVVR